jgi:hypothetical protein
MAWHWSLGKDSRMKHCTGTAGQSNVVVFEAPPYEEPQLYQLRADGKITYTPLSNAGINVIFTRNGSDMGVPTLQVQPGADPESRSFDKLFLMTAGETLGFRVPSTDYVTTGVELQIEWEIDFRLVRVLDELEP